MTRRASQVRAEQRVYWRNRSDRVLHVPAAAPLPGVFAAVGSDREVDGRPYAEFFVPGHARLGDRRDDVRRPRHHARHPPRARRAQARARHAAAARRRTWARSSPRTPSCWPPRRLIVLAARPVAFDVDLPGALAGARGRLMALGAACFAALGIAVYAASCRTPRARRRSSTPSTCRCCCSPAPSSRSTSCPASWSGWPRSLPLTPPARRDARRASPTAASRGDDARRACWCRRLGRRGGAVVALRTFRWEPRGG